ncbi:MAG: diphthine--ammonia ligase [Candidatus Omnitrophica bacterium]|nr:diphthine--ammonia ligase [Candidatus Omnitrophota bacterium]MDD5574022.1 diphthine--ammonia ligase [Candidatus Omnitrophota bacterium]
MTETNKKAIASWSGGKDSCLACYKAVRQGYNIKFLLNFISRGSGRGCFHGLEGRLLKFQADLIGIPLIQREVSPDMGRYEEEFKAAVTELKKPDIETMVFGDIYLLEHESWIERVCRDIGIAPLEPLWENHPENIVEEFIRSGFKAIIVSCKADTLGQEFLGRTLDQGLIEEFKKRSICPCGEKGEFHTLVVDGPMFRKPIRIVKAEAILKEGFWKHWFLDIQEYR